LENGIEAKEIMTEGVESVDSKDDLNKALEIMNKLKSFVCPVTENGKIVGLISYHDLMNYVMDSLKE
jgi:predicted transcriptional regulator